MTCHFTRTTALALALALGLAGCGGKATFPLSGTVTGLVYDGLILSSNGMTLPVAKASTTFTFPNALTYGEAYAVTVFTDASSVIHQPQHETCLLTSASDTAGRLASINVIATCALNQFAIGGAFTADSTLNGVMPAGLVLTNGSLGGTTTATVAGDTTFTFGTTVPYGVSYGVTVLTQPAGATCTVGPNGTGTMGDAAVANIAVSCVATVAPAATS